ncbi:MAG: alpha-glucan family phosphorylase [Phycisphaerales bacterium]
MPQAVATRSSKKRSRQASPLDRAACLAHNLWWTWTPEARRLFERMDPDLWEVTNHNPVATISRLSPWRRDALLEDESFAAEIDAVETSLGAYLKEPGWFSRDATKDQRGMLVAYFCMEYALYECLPLYAGGLGVLAGDHLRSASDLGIPLVALGVLWKYGYYRQEIELSGDVKVLYPESDFNELPVTDTKKTITVPIGKSKVKAKIWRCTVGKVDLYLLDTDLPDNKPADRRLTHHLYGGDHTYRIRQEILLGIGGLIALDKLGLKPTVHHLNEGHAAFCGLERMRRLVNAGMGIDEAQAHVRETSVFTTHTPVPEGNDRFEPALFNRYLGHYRDELAITKDELLALGREDESDLKEPFCMTVLALKLAEHCNGVAKLHAETSRGMWAKTYGLDDPRKAPIGHVTNGIHVETWLADEARPFYDKHLKPKWVGAGPEDDWWKRADRVPAEDLWELRQMLRRKLIAFLRDQMRKQILAHGGGAPEITELYDTLDEDALTIGFARRFALYKRAPLIFKDIKRLAGIMGDAKRPVQIIFAGKAHPQDEAGHEYVKQVQTFARKAPFRGRVFLLENYDMNIGRQLTQGCDLWLNNPIRPMEASGTSGMKPPLNAGLNFSILDGWWPEAYDKRNGWAIGDPTPQPTRAKQDKYDAEQIYHTLEHEIVPLFYERNSKGVPTKWMKRVAHSMKTICAEFSTHRMLAEYAENYYNPAHNAERR